MAIETQPDAGLETEAVEAPIGRRPRIFRTEVAWVPFALLVVLAVGVSIVQPSFLSIVSIQNVLVQAAPILIIAVGLTPTILLGGLDLSVAALTSLACILLALTTPTMGTGGLLLVLVLCAAAGAIVGYVHAVAQIPSFIVTLGAMGLYGGLGYVLSNATNLPMGAGGAAVAWASGGIAMLPVSFVVSVVILLIGSFLLSRTLLGRQIYAIGSAETGAIVQGISPVLVRVVCYAFSALCAALAGVWLVAGLSYASPGMADTYLLPSIAAVLVGGTAISGGVGSLWRTLVGALIIMVIQSGMVFVKVDPTVSNLVFGVVIIVAVALTTDRRKLSIVK